MQAIRYLLLAAICASFPALGGPAGQVAARTGEQTDEVRPRPKRPGTVRIGTCQPRNRTIDFRLAPSEMLAQVDKSLDELANLVHKAGAAGCDAVALPEDTLGLGKWLAANQAASAEKVTGNAKSGGWRFAAL